MIRRFAVTILYIVSLHFTPMSISAAENSAANSYTYDIKDKLATLSCGGTARLHSGIFVVVDFNKFNLIKSFIEKLPP